MTPGVLASKRLRAMGRGLCLCRMGHYLGSPALGDAVKTRGRTAVLGRGKDQGHVATRGRQGQTSQEDPLLEPQEELDPVDTSISKLASECNRLRCHCFKPVCDPGFLARVCPGFLQAPGLGTSVVLLAGGRIPLVCLSVRCQRPAHTTWQGRLLGG